MFEKELFRPPAPTPNGRTLGLFQVLATLRRNPLECFSEEHFNEPIATVRLPIGQVLLVHEPTAIRHVLLDNATNYRKDPLQRRVLSAGQGEGLLSAEGEQWQAQRRTLAPLFARRTVIGFAPAMQAAAQGVVERWRQFASGSVIDVAAEMALVTLNVLALTIFSDGIIDDLDEFRRATSAYFGVIGRIGALDLFGVPEYVPRPGRARLHETLAYFDNLIDGLISRRREMMARSRDHAPADLLTLLLRALDPSTQRPMNIAEVKSNILTFLSAGHETTANSLTWSLFLLSQSPEWRARVEAEVDAEMAGPAEGLAERLVVTRAVIDEAVRLYPPIAAMSRIADGPDQLGSYQVKRRTLIVMAPYVLHRHRKLWDRPDVFDPRRFLGEEKQRVDRFAYMPFGAGVRTCIGSTFALQEATLVLAALVKNFKMQLSPDARVWPMLRVTLRPENGLPMLIEPRQPARRMAEATAG
jgi:cytochrome P450